MVVLLMFMVLLILLNLLMLLMLLLLVMVLLRLLLRMLLSSFAVAGVVAGDDVVIVAGSARTDVRRLGDGADSGSVPHRAYVRTLRRRDAAHMHGLHKRLEVIDTCLDRLLDARVRSDPWRPQPEVAHLPLFVGVGDAATF
mgnify:CR=1 FL=1